MSTEKNPKSDQIIFQNLLDYFKPVFEKEGGIINQLLYNEIYKLLEGSLRKNINNQQLCQEWLKIGDNCRKNLLKKNAINISSGEIFGTKLVTSVLITFLTLHKFSLNEFTSLFNNQLNKELSLPKPDFAIIRNLLIIGAQAAIKHQTVEGFNEFLKKIDLKTLKETEAHSTIKNIIAEVKLAWDLAVSVDEITRNSLPLEALQPENLLIHLFSSEKNDSSEFFRDYIAFISQLLKSVSSVDHKNINKTLFRQLLSAGVEKAAKAKFDSYGVIKSRVENISTSLFSYFSSEKNYSSEKINVKEQIFSPVAWEFMDLLNTLPNFFDSDQILAWKSQILLGQAKLAFESKFSTVEEQVAALKSIYNFCTESNLQDADLHKNLFHILYQRIDKNILFEEKTLSLINIESNFGKQFIAYALDKHLNESKAKLLSEINEKLLPVEKIIKDTELILERFKDYDEKFYNEYKSKILDKEKEFLSFQEAARFVPEALINIKNTIPHFYQAITIVGLKECLELNKSTQEQVSEIFKNKVAFEENFKTFFNAIENEANKLVTENKNKYTILLEKHTHFNSTYEKNTEKFHNMLITMKEFQKNIHEVIEKKYSSEKNEEPVETMLTNINHTIDVFEKELTARKKFLEEKKVALSEISLKISQMESNEKYSFKDQLNQIDQFEKIMANTEFTINQYQDSINSKQDTASESLSAMGNWIEKAGNEEILNEEKYEAAKKVYTNILLDIENKLDEFEKLKSQHEKSKTKFLEIFEKPKKEDVFKNYPQTVKAVFEELDDALKMFREFLNTQNYSFSEKDNEIQDFVGIHRQGTLVDQKKKIDDFSEEVTKITENMKILINENLTVVTQKLNEAKNLLEETTKNILITCNKQIEIINQNKIDVEKKILQQKNSLSFLQDKISSTEDEWLKTQINAFNFDPNILSEKTNLSERKEIVNKIMEAANVKLKSEKENIASQFSEIKPLSKTILEKIQNSRSAIELELKSARLTAALAPFALFASFFLHNIPGFSELSLVVELRKTVEKRQKMIKEVKQLNRLESTLNFLSLNVPSIRKSTFLAAHKNLHEIVDSLQLGKPEKIDGLITHVDNIFKSSIQLTVAEQVIAQSTQLKEIKGDQEKLDNINTELKTLNATKKALDSLSEEILKEREKKDVQVQEISNLPLPKEKITARVNIEPELVKETKKPLINFTQNSILRKQKMNEIQAKKISDEATQSLLDAIDINGDTLLHAAVHMRDVESVKLLLTYEADISIENSKGKSASNLASFYLKKKSRQIFSDVEKSKEAEIVTLLTKYNEQEYTPSLKKLSQQYTSMRMKLKQKLAELQRELTLMSTGEKQTSLTDITSALKREHENLLTNTQLPQKKVQLLNLIKNTHDMIILAKTTMTEIKRLPWYGDSKGEWGIHKAVKNGVLNEEQWEKNSDRFIPNLNRPTNHGYTPLQLAIAYAATESLSDQMTSLEMVKCLVEKGANVNANTYQPLGLGITKTNTENPGIIEKKTVVPALSIAIQINAVDIVAYLLSLKDSQKVNVNLQDERGETALHYLARRSDRRGIEMTKLLLEQNPNNTIKNREGKTPWDIATEQENTHFLSLLPKKNNPLSSVTEKAEEIFALTSTKTTFFTSQNNSGITDNQTDSFKEMRTKAKPAVEEEIQNSRTNKQNPSH